MLHSQSQIEGFDNFFYFLAWNKLMKSSMKTDEIRLLTKDKIMFFIFTFVTIGFMVKSITNALLIMRFLAQNIIF